MASTRSRASDLVPSGAVRRFGQFSVGAFAGACALFAPRLTLMVGQSAHSPVTVEALSPTFVVGAVLLSLLVGGVAMILEWDGTRSPKDTFMAALGVPALLSGVFSTANVSKEAVRLAEITRGLADERAREEGIVVEETPQASLSPARGRWPAVPYLMPTAHAAASQAAAVKTADPQSGVAIHYRQARYWIVLHEDSVKSAADRRASELGRRYGALSVQALGDGYAVTLGRGALPYSEAVSRAVEVKKQSLGAIMPKLVRAG